MKLLCFSENPRIDTFLCFSENPRIDTFWCFVSVTVSEWSLANRGYCTAAATGCRVVGGQGGACTRGSGGTGVVRTVVPHRGTGPGSPSTLFPHCNSTVAPLYSHWTHCTATGPTVQPGTLKNSQNQSKNSGFPGFPCLVDSVVYWLPNPYWFSDTFWRKLQKFDTFWRKLHFSETSDLSVTFWEKVVKFHKFQWFSVIFVFCQFWHEPLGLDRLFRQKSAVLPTTISGFEKWSEKCPKSDHFREKVEKWPFCQKLWGLGRHF